MMRRSYTPERIINKLREAEVLKRVERIWRREGFKVPKRQPKRGRLSSE